MNSLNTDKLKILHQKILEFNTVRGWDPLDQNIAKSIVIEAAELLEHFQWDNDPSLPPKERDLEDVGDEIADILWYIFLLCNKLNINLADAVEHKYLHNVEKYPAELFRDKHSNHYYSQKKKYRLEK
ncbi:MAG: nucleotide pyrophosphohydrolase, partial [Oligoflexia bacterium]|nr:nucleotide pyrophosphohydrolase [Oligoflexia bacterium]